MAINANKMWSMYLFNQNTPKNGAELLDESIIRDGNAKGDTLTLSAKASVGWATCCPRV